MMYFNTDVKKNQQGYTYLAIIYSFQKLFQLMKNQNMFYRMLNIGLYTHVKMVGAITFSQVF